MSDKKEDDGLKLSLSLGFGVGYGNGDGGEEKKKKNLNPSPTPCFPLSLLPSSSNLPAPQQWPSFLADALFQTPSSSERNGVDEPRSFLRGIDVNRPAAAAVYYEDVIVSSPNSTVSSVSGKRSEREENEAERGWSSMEEDGGDAAAGRKKLRLSKEQAAVLEETFEDHHTLNPKQKLALAKQLNLRPRQVEVWFQNRRARTKLKQTEVDCEYLKRCCEQMAEENRRLQKEVNELRALKLSPQFYMNMSPPTTLTMCPQCERVAVSSSAAAAATASTAPLASTIGVPARQPNPTKPLNPWAAIFPSQSLYLRQPGS